MILRARHPSVRTRPRRFAWLLLGLLIAVGSVNLVVAEPALGAGCGSSLQARINKATAGATLNLTGCTYTAGATISKRLTLIGARIYPQAGTRGLIVTASGVTIDSVLIVGPQATTYRWNEVGILTTGSVSNLVIRDSTLRSFGNTGIWLGATTDARVVRNVVKDAVYAGIMDISGNGDRIARNTVRRIGVVGASANSNNAYGIAISNEGGSVSRNIKVHRNLVVRVPTWHGLDVHGGRRVTFSDNVVKVTPRALFITSDSLGRRSDTVMVTGNRFVRPTSATDRKAVTLYNTIDVTVTGNYANGWGRGHFLNDYLGLSTGLRVSKNTVIP